MVLAICSPLRAKNKIEKQHDPPNRNPHTHSLQSNMVERATEGMQEKGDLHATPTTLSIPCKVMAMAATRMACSKNFDL